MTGALAAYVRGRLLLGLAVIAAVSAAAFALIHLSGDLAASLAGPEASPQDVERLRAVHGLDRPLPVQYAAWLSAVAQGDLGRSLFSHGPVASEIAARLPVTATLGLGATVLALLLGVTLGVLSALAPDGPLDRAIGAVVALAQGVPAFFLGLLLILLLGVEWRLLPISGSDGPAHFVLPIVTLATVLLPGFQRLARSGMLEELASDYVRTARAKGLPARRVVVRHALANALLPLVSLAAVNLGFALGGTVIVEAVFALDGIGYLAYQAILRADFPVVQGVVLLTSAIYVALTTGADILNAAIDPRIALR